METTENLFTEGTTTEADDLADNFNQLYIDIENWLYKITFIAFPVLGGFGNILTFIVMRGGSLKNVSTCFYMSMLALADTGKCIGDGYHNVFIR